MGVKLATSDKDDQERSKKMLAKILKKSRPENRKEVQMAMKKGE